MRRRAQLPVLARRSRRRVLALARRVGRAGRCVRADLAPVGGRLRGAPDRPTTRTTRRSPATGATSPSTARSAACTASGGATWQTGAVGRSPAATRQLPSISEDGRYVSFTTNDRAPATDDATPRPTCTCATWTSPTPAPARSAGMTTASARKRARSRSPRRSASGNQGLDLRLRLRTGDSKKLTGRGRQRTLGAQRETAARSRS